VTPPTSAPASPSPSQPATPPLFVGIDVAKDKLDLAASDTDAVAAFPNDPAGHDRLVELLAGRRPTVIVVEATGGYEWPLVQALLEADLPVARVNPGDVRHLAKGLRILAKSDPIDARLLARFAQVAEPRLLEKASHNQAELHALVTCRRGLCQSLTQQTNRLDMTRSKLPAKALGKVIKTLQTQIDALDKAIADLIDADDEFRDNNRLLQTIPGVGPVAAATVVASVPEIGNARGRQAAALVGVVPYDHDSGRFKGQRSIAGGRAEPRNVLYMAALTARWCNPLIKAFADRLKSRGKKHKVVIVACIHKLVTLMNVMLRDRLTWDQLTVVKNFVPTP
jgi:transposase